ncbi:MAG: hypothetical protein CSA45_04910 [Gammaproteobacteria bacterium]|nr:MAG: hypothetical protein CSA45_04910 [Gammaproteobacteria bacterium]
MTKSVIAAIQLNSDDNINLNIDKIDFWVSKAKQQGASIVLLPENCAYMAQVQGDSKKIAEPLGNGAVQSEFANIAKNNDIWLIVGAFPTIEDNLVYQTLLVYNHLGQLVEYYHKCHLFNVTLPDSEESYRESDAFAYGKEYKVVDTPIGRIGLAICYDLRFPEQFRQLVDKGATSFVLPAAFTYHTGQAHWESLLRARAIENQCYVIASAQVGKHPGGRKTWGHSCIIDSWGKVQSCLQNEEGLIVSDINLETVTRERHVFPVLTHR